MINVGVIGIGYWGPNIVRNLSRNSKCKLRYCCDLKPSLTQMIHRNYPAVKVTTDYHHVLRDPAVDAVAVITPLSSHFPIAREALLAGKHVFVEKPFVSTALQAKELVDIAAKKRRVLMVGQTYLYSPAVQKIKRMIDSGELGSLHHIHSTRVHFGHLRPNESVIWDLASHDLSIVFYWLKNTEYTVFCSGRDCLRRGFPDTANITLEFNCGGPVVYIFVSWLAPIKMRNMSITGSKKMIFFNDLRTSEEIKIYDQQAVERIPEAYGEPQMIYRTGDILTPRLEGYEPMAAEIDDFLSCIGTGRKCRSNAKFNLDVIRALEAIDLSRRIGQKVAVKR
jgi:predicted dehydrogenase